MLHRTLVIWLTGAALLGASGGSGGSGGGQKQNPDPPNTAEVHISNEVVPAGGTVQMKALLTEPRPITSTGGGHAVGKMSVDGVALWSQKGDAAGVGVLNDGFLYISAISPTGSLGEQLDGPFLTITMTVPSDVNPGSEFPLDLEDTSMTAATGSLHMVVVPGTLRIGGSVSIHGIYPGGGTWPAGTIVRMFGSGFSDKTRIQTRVKAGSITVVSPEEIDITLKEQTTLDLQEFQAVNPDGSSVTYYSYLRATMLRTPKHALLHSAEPVFQQLTHTSAKIGPLPNLNQTQFIGLALQNPNPAPVHVTLTSHEQSTSIVLPSGTRIMDDLSSLMNGDPVACR